MKKVFLFFMTAAAVASAEPAPAPAPPRAGLADLSKALETISDCFSIAQQCAT